MQKYKIWIILALLVLCILTLILWLSPKENTQADTGTKMPLTETQAEQTALLVNGPANAAFPSASQQDTEINCQMQLDASNRLIVNEQTRNCFEYFITQFGEKICSRSNRILKPIFARIIKSLHSRKFWIYGIVISSTVRAWASSLHRPG